MLPCILVNKDFQSVKLHPRDKRTHANNRIWCILALNAISGVNTFNDFPDNQLTKFRVFISLSRIVILP